MNIFLIPYTWMRHFQVALWLGILTTTAWWLHLEYYLLYDPFWSSEYDGFMWLVTLVFTASGGSILIEGNLRRTKFRWRVIKLLTSIGVSCGLFFLLFMLYDTTIGALFFSVLDLFKTESLQRDVVDTHQIIFQNQFGLFLCAGFCVSVGTLFSRKWKGLHHIGNHIMGGLIAGCLAACVWMFFFYFMADFGNHLYYSGAISSLVFGFGFGLSAWTIPDDLYAGWIRIMSPTRFGHRVPIDAIEGNTKERFIGSYKNGLDAYMPDSEGVMELHISAYVNANQEYFLRGLSQKSTLIKRMLESVRMDYDPRSPQPAETQLYSEDIVVMGEAGKVEFIMLPREEK